MRGGGGEGALQVLIAGDGPLRAALERDAPPGAVFAGEVRGPRRDAVFAAADVLCVPSLVLASGRSEGVPLALLEGLAAGVPVVAAAAGGIAAAAGDAALLFPPGDPGACAAALTAALEDPAAAAARASRGRARVAVATWDRAAGVVEEALTR